MSCHWTKAHDQMVRELSRMCQAAGLTVVIEPVGVMEGERLPDLLIPGHSKNNQQTLVDFTSVSQTQTSHIDHSWKNRGYSAEKACSEKFESYRDKYDNLNYEFLPLAMEIGGHPSKTLMNFLQAVAKIAGINHNRSTDIRIIYQTSFINKWKSRIITAFMATQAQNSLQLLQNIINKEPRVLDIRYLLLI